MSRPQAATLPHVAAKTKVVCIAIVCILGVTSTPVSNAQDSRDSVLKKVESRLRGIYEESEFQWRSRTTQLSFTYRLNQKKQRQRGRGGQEEGGFEEGDINFGS